VRVRAALVGLLILVLTAPLACTPSPAGRSGPPASPPTAGHHAMTLAAATAAQTSPRQRRAQFEQLLGLHALLAVRLMRGVVAAAPDFVPVASAALQDDTDALSQLVTAAYGDAQGDRFRQLWQRHVSDLFSYAKGVAANDTSARQAARAALLADAEAYEHMFTASSGRSRQGEPATRAGGRPRHAAGAAAVGVCHAAG
jgi:hypothetical protein